MNSLSIKSLPEEWMFPTTRYRGSKRKILPWIWNAIKDLAFDSTLDLFGGTGVMSSLFKRMGKEVTYNDYLHYNYMSAVALIENSTTVLTDEDLDFIFSEHPKISYGCFVADIFRGYYFLDAENRWLDRTIANISALGREYSGKVLREKKAIAVWAIGQACLIKRPFNLFHRKNLYLRTEKAERGFGNKSTWETPFEDAMRRFVKEANQVIFDNGRRNRAFCTDALRFKDTDFDLVYLDPPYFFEGQSNEDYKDLYHFLEGVAQPHIWPELIDYDSYNLRLKRNGTRWPAKSSDQLTNIYSSLIDRFSDSVLVISHKSNSLVSLGTIKNLLANHGKQVRTHWKRYTYALSHSNGKPSLNIEWLIIGT